MKYDLIIFDCDGTLVDTEPVTTRLISKMMSERGITFSPEECLEEFAGKNIMCITAFMEKFIGPFDHIVFEEEYRSRCLNIFDEELESIPGVFNILKRLKVSKCIASNGPKNKMEVTLKVTGIIDYFKSEHIFSAYDIKKWKPAPELYLHAIEKMGVEKDRALVIEDTVPGVLGAINGSIDVIAYNPTDDTHLINQPIANFNSMADIEDFLDEQGVLI